MHEAIHLLTAGPYRPHCRKGVSSNLYLCYPWFHALVGNDPLSLRGLDALPASCPPSLELANFYRPAYDSLFLEIANPHPSAKWYTKLLAARNTLYAYWIANPKTHTQCGTHIPTLLCNVLGIMDIRFLPLKPKANYSRLTRPLPIEVAEILTRPAIEPHDARLSDVYNFIAAEVLGLTAPLLSHRLDLVNC